MKKFIIGIVIAFVLSFSACGVAEVPPAEPETAGDFLVIAGGADCDFYIIRGDMADQSEISDAVRLRKKLAEKLGTEIGITTDWDKNPVYEHEIIIGKTLREADSPIDRIDLGETGYIIKEENGKIFISGGTDEGTSLAVDYFIENFIDSSDGKIEIPTGFVHIVHHQYDIPGFYIDMKQVDNSRTIAVPSGADKKVTSASEELQKIFYEKTGLMLEISNDSGASNAAFVISNEKASTDSVHEIVVSDGKLVFSSSAKSGVAACVEVFIDNYLADATGSINFPADFRYLDLGDYIAVSYPDVD